MLARFISVAAIHEDSKKQETALSIQRAASFLLRIAKSIYKHIMASLRCGKKKFMEKMNLFKKE